MWEETIPGYEYSSVHRNLQVAGFQGCKRTQRKDKERQEEEEVAEELKRFTTQEMAGGFSLLEEALLAFETQDQMWNGT